MPPSPRREIKLVSCRSASRHDTASRSGRRFLAREIKSTFGYGEGLRISCPTYLELLIASTAILSSISG
jgi:hypothetical protein